MVILNSPSGEQYISISWGSPCGHLSCSFIWNIFACFFILLDSLYRCQCIRQISHLSSFPQIDFMQGKATTSQPVQRFQGPLKSSCLSNPFSLVGLFIYLFIYFLQPPSIQYTKTSQMEAGPSDSSQKTWIFEHCIQLFPTSKRSWVWGFSSTHSVLSQGQGCDYFQISISVQFSSVAQSCPTLWNPKDCSMPDLPIHHQLPEFTQTHVHRVSDAIQPSHPLSSPSPPAFSLSQHQGLFKSLFMLSLIPGWLDFPCFSLYCESLKSERSRSSVYLP